MCNGKFKAITGVRRCGKSVLLFDLFFEHLLWQGVSEGHILKLSWISVGISNSEIQLLCASTLKALFSLNGINYFFLFIDEVQLASKVAAVDNGGFEVTHYNMLSE